jgi:hypothetical protein
LCRFGGFRPPNPLHGSRCDGRPSSDVQLLGAISHEDIDRLRNEELYLNLDSLYGTEFPDGTFGFVIFLKDSTFSYGLVIPEKYANENFHYGFKTFVQGKWNSIGNEKFELVTRSAQTLHLSQDPSRAFYVLTDDGNKIMMAKLDDPKKEEFALMSYMFVSNQEIYQ